MVTKKSEASCKGNYFRSKITVINTITAAALVLLLVFDLSSIFFTNEYEYVPRNLLDEKYELLYHNQKDVMGDEPVALKDNIKDGPVIAVLVTNLEKDIEDLLFALKSLRFLHGDDKDKPAPILVFNEGDLSESQKDLIVKATSRPIAFPLVDFSEFPEGFDPEGKAGFLVRGRQKWGYYQMIRFWVSGIWSHPAIDPFKSVMRIDSDSCFMEHNNILPKLPHDDIVYHSQYVGYEPAKETVSELFDFTVDWLIMKDKMPANPMMWRFIQSTWEKTGTFPVLRTNFEVSRKSFMQDPDVYEWLKYVTEQQPFGIFQYRWGDAVIRFIMIAIFAENHMVVLSKPDGYAHKNLCNSDEYLGRYGKIGTLPDES